MRRRETLQIQIDQTEMREQVSGPFRRIRMKRVRTRIERGSNVGAVRGVRLLNQGWWELKWGHKLHKRGPKCTAMSRPCDEKAVPAFLECSKNIEKYCNLHFYLQTGVRKVAPISQINVFLKI